MTDPEFSRIPYLALPTMMLIIVVIGVGVALHFQSAVESVPPTPTTVEHNLPVVETVVPLFTENCVILEQVPEYTVYKCYKHILDGNI